MLGKLLTLIVFIIAIGAALLGMRQYRLNIQGDMTRLHHEMNQSRKELWDMQVRIARQTEPQALRQAVQRAQLELEPITPATQPAATQPDESAAGSSAPAP